MADNKIHFIDISVHNRHIRSIQQERDLTSHSLGYLDFLDQDIDTTVIRFGDAFEQSGRFRLFRYNFRDALRVFRFFNSKKNAVVLFHGFSFPFRFVLFRNLLGRNLKWIVQHHAGNPSSNGLKRKIQKWSYSKADAFIFVTKEQAMPFVEAGIIQSIENVWEIMECSTGFQMSDKSTARELKLDETQKMLIWVGNLDANKDPLCLLHALKKYRENNRNFKLYMFYGKAELLPEVKSFITQNGLQGNVILKGKVAHSALEKWYNAADFFIACSHSEGSGVALAESMACGCIPIVSNIPSFVAMTGNAGFRFTVGRSENLLMQLHKLDEIDVAEASFESQRQFEKELSFQAIGKKTSKLIKSFAD